MYHREWRSCKDLKNKFYIHWPQNHNKLNFNRFEVGQIVKYKKWPVLSFCLSPNHMTSLIKWIFLVFKETMITFFGLDFRWPKQIWQRREEARLGIAVSRFQHCSLVPNQHISPLQKFAQSSRWTNLNFRTRFFGQSRSCHRWTGLSTFWSTCFNRNLKN